MSERIDYDEMAAAYDDGRSLRSEWVVEWRKALQPYIGDARAPVLDIGSGTGIWSFFLAEWFNVEVVGIEPSSGMRATARRKRSHPRVKYVAGEAGHLPLREDSCSSAWLSTVVHHIPDVQAAAREMRRVLQPGGRVLIRNAFSGRHDAILWTRFFPSALEIAERRHPSVEATVQAFSVAGFVEESLQRVVEVSASSLDEYVKRTETRADSSLTMISDEEFERGLEELRRAAENEPPSPVRTGLDLLVLR